MTAAKVHLLFCVGVLLVGRAFSYNYTFPNETHPITLVTTSLGAGNFERVESLRARIFPHHVLPPGHRSSFAQSGEIGRRFDRMKAEDDDRGHILASQFSGPPKWYNLIPQSSRVNRNKKVRYITADWYGAEHKVRSFLLGGGDVFVDWSVDMIYNGAEIRPHELELNVIFYVDGRVQRDDTIFARIRNLFSWQNSTMYVCSKQRKLGTTPRPDLIM